MLDKLYTWDGHWPLKDQKQRNMEHGKRVQKEYTNTKNQQPSYLHEKATCFAVSNCQEKNRA